MKPNRPGGFEEEWAMARMSSHVPMHSVPDRINAGRTRIQTLVSRTKIASRSQASPGFS